MILRNGDYGSLAQYIKDTGKKIIIYGAGMIGQIVIPFLIEQNNLIDYVECFVDADGRKTGRRIIIGQTEFEIKSLDYLHQELSNIVILITNSKFIPVVEFLDKLESLKKAEAFLIPVMQVEGLKNTRQIWNGRVSDIMFIPKKIHYCWFGRKEMPVFLKQCIESWRRMCPDYEIVCWNEDNYDVSQHIYTKEAYEQKRYGFVSDVARLDILYSHGGIYFDTDVTLLKNIDELLYQQAFIGVEKWGNINSGGGCGCVAGHPAVKAIIDYRDQFHFILPDGTLNVDTNGIYESAFFLGEGFKPNGQLQIVKGVTIFPPQVFHPYDYMSSEEQIEEWTFAKHHFYGGWMEKTDIDNRSDTQRKYRQFLERIER